MLERASFTNFQLAGHFLLGQLPHHGFLKTAEEEDLLRCPQLMNSQLLTVSPHSIALWEDAATTQLELKSSQRTPLSHSLPSQAGQQSLCSSPSMPSNTGHFCIKKKGRWGSSGSTILSTVSVTDWKRPGFKLSFPWPQTSTLTPAWMFSCGVYSFEALETQISKTPCVPVTSQLDTHRWWIYLVTWLYQVYVKPSLSTKEEMISSAVVEMGQVSQDFTEEEEKAHRAGSSTLIKHRRSSELEGKTTKCLKTVA